GKEGWRNKGEQLTEYSGSGHVSTESPMAHFELSWKRQGGVLTLKVDDEFVAEAEDTDISEFSRILIRGNGSVFFDNVTVRLQ
ncbi:MAG: hypothetical protein ACQKBT_13265, partial [Puniceicoccales bacterium]